MSGCGHEHSGDGHSHGHSHGGHDHESWERGAEYSLYKCVDTPRVRCLNSASAGQVPVFKPWDQRLDTTQYIESDADEQLILFIPFTGSVTLKGIKVIGGRDGACPSHMKLYANNELIDFDSVEGMTPLQEFDMLEDIDGRADYNTRIARFTGISSLTIFFDANHGADLTRITYIGLKGDFRPMNRNPVVSVYEASANPADHKTRVSNTAGNQLIG